VAAVMTFVTAADGVAVATHDLGGRARPW